MARGRIGDIYIAAALQDPITMRRVLVHPSKYGSRTTWVYRSWFHVGFEPIQHGNQYQPVFFCLMFDVVTDFYDPT